MRAASCYEQLARQKRLHEFNLADFGFELTTEQIEDYLRSIDMASWSFLPVRSKPKPKAA